MWYPFLVVAFDVLTIICTKFLFVRFKAANYRSFVWWLFIWIIVVALVVSPWLFHIDPSALEHRYLWWLIALAFLATNHNLLYYYSLEYEKIAEIEPFLLFNPLVAIVIASLFYADERSWHIYAAAIIAVVVLAWSHLKRQHLRLGKPLVALLLFSVLYGLEAIVIRHLLAVYSPLALYLVRAIAVALFLLVLEKGKIAKLPLRQVPYFLLIAVGAVAASVSLYLAYQTVGISLTIFILLLSPVLVYLLSVLCLRERLKWKNLVASAVIIGLVIWLAIVR